MNIVKKPSSTHKLGDLCVGDLFQFKDPKNTWETGFFYLSKDESTDRLISTNIRDGISRNIIDLFHRKVIKLKQINTLELEEE